MIYGIGTDLLRISRGDQLWERHGDRAAAKLLHPLELAQFASSTKRGHFLARAFAAKEAFVKALGTGFRSVAFSDVGVIRKPECRPQFVFSESLQARLMQLGIRNTHLSLSDDGDFIFAFAILETADS
jgi:holo-[acyl-carrier protein] synthase